jgi:cytochrome c-type biogenesis protein CcmH/NrfG
MLVRDSGDPDSTERAIDLFKEALKHAPDDPYCIFALAQQFVRKGAYTLAIPYLERLIDHPYDRTRELSRPMLLDCYAKQGEMLKYATLKSKISSKK